MSLVQKTEDALLVVRHTKILHQFIDNLNQAVRANSEKDIKDWCEFLAYECEKINLEAIETELKAELNSLLNPIDDKEKIK
ncbi:MAG: hypothetical protein KGV56_03305 [Gammaproteobacteria bacterium]|nr:hypothetical protein [Gammaproteobacteria bacterium]